MDLELNWINLLILFGALHGLIFGIVLLANRKHPGAKFLAAFMFILSYNGLETFNWSSGLDEYTIVFNLFTFVWIYGLGPSLYLYVCSLLWPDKNFSRKKITLLYLPLIFQFLMNTVVLSFYIYTLKSGSGWPDRDVLVLYEFYHMYSEPLSVVVFIVYLTFSIIEYMKARRDYGQTLKLKNPKKIVLGWLKGLLIAMGVLAFIWPVLLIAASVYDLSDGQRYYPIEVLLVFFIYWIAFIGYHKIKMIYLKDIGSKLSKEEIGNSLIRLQTAMEQEKLFLDSELNRDKLAQHLNMNPKIISMVLNQHANQNFNDFINAYRVEEVAKRLKSHEHNNLTISGIALESGFNSQATFQRVFKAFKGVSPKEFQNMHVQYAKN
uniref:helix-turn-helix domain-containing protein n=1 Tax=Fulvivirga sp. TaxID=1931237 RepID=UPI004048F7D6